MSFSRSWKCLVCLVCLVCLLGLALVAAPAAQAHRGMPGVAAGPLAVPGQIQVRLSVDGKTASAPLRVMRDPNSRTNLAAMPAALQLQLRIADDVRRVAGMVNLSEQMRAQLERLARRHAGNAPMLTAARDTDQSIQDVEYQLFSRYLAPSDDQIYASAWKVCYHLLWLNGGTGAGDIAGGDDFGPADVQPKLLALLESDLDQGTARYQTLMARIPAFNDTLRRRGAIPLDSSLKPLPDLPKAYPRE